MQRAVGLHAKGQLADAEKAYRDVLVVMPKNFDAWHLLGVLQYQKGQHADALASYEQALTANPNHVELLNNRGMALRDLGRAAEALASIERALAVKPGFTEALNNRGIAFARARSTDRGDRELRRRREVQRALRRGLPESRHWAFPERSVSTTSTIWSRTRM